MTPFHIVTEFKFDIASAVVNSEALQSKVEGISGAANQALLDIKRVGVGLIANLGLFQSGFFGFIYQAVQSSEKFEQSQRNLANIFLANSKLFKSINFNSAMNLSENMMNEIGTKGFKFGIDPNALADQVKIIAPMLLAKGKDDPMTLHNSMEIARGLLKSAPTLGIDPGNLGMQLIDMVSGKADGNNTLFNRLVADTSAFKNAGVTNSKSFNTMEPKRQLQVFMDAITEFGNNAEVVDGNMKSVNNQMSIFRNLLLGQFSIFKSIGKTFGTLISNIMQVVNNWINTKGRVIAEQIGKLFDMFLADPEKAIAQIYQMTRLKKDFAMAGEITKFMGYVEAARNVLKMFNIDASKLKVLGPGFKIIEDLTGGFGDVLASAFRGKGIFGGLLIVAKSVVGILARVFLPLMFFFQIISRAIGYAKINDIKAIFTLSADAVTAFAKLSNAFRKIFMPIEMAIDFFARLASSLFTVGPGLSIFITLVEGLASVFDFLGDVVVGILSLVSGIVHSIVSIYAHIARMDFLGLLKGGQFKDGWEGGKDFWNNAQGMKPGDKELPVAANVTHIGSVTIQQQFKEQMEPDRIAFSVVDMLNKVASNPTQAANGSLRGLGVR